MAMKVHAWQPPVLRWWAST